MLPKSHIFAYQEFLSALELLQKEATVCQPAPSYLFSQFQQVQKVFQEKIITLNNEDNPPHSRFERGEFDDLNLEIINKIQKINTEIHRELRLLSTSIMFLQSSRSSATSQARLTAIIERINTLIALCQLLITGVGGF